ncbi:MAG: zinc-ribbon domain-containing protein, partial [Deltaproteobacteria bacterium]|nr:zinc-ribbon domain-containing protein [Deltaproteobacteria bacterium]
MIVQCDKCKAKFRLNDSKVTGKGVKVRCSKCRNLFMVTPPPPSVEEVPPRKEAPFGVSVAPPEETTPKKEEPFEFPFGSMEETPQKKEEPFFEFSFGQETPSERPDEPLPSFDTGFQFGERPTTEEPGEEEKPPVAQEKEGVPSFE